MTSEWVELPLGDVITLQRGFDLPSQNRRSGKVPIVSSSGISDYHAEASAKGPGVVTGRYGTIGRVFLIKEDYWPLNTTLWVKDFHGNDPLFVSYLLRTVDFRSCSDKSSVPGVNRNDLHRIPVLRPPLNEQKAIAGVLGALDEKIESNGRMNATLEAIARALFQSWFVDFDPVRAILDGRDPAGIDAATAALFPESFNESAIGHLPTDWAVVSLYETAQWVNGAAFRNDDFCTVGEGLPIIKIAELKDGVDSQTKWSQREASSNQTIDTGNLLYSWSGSPDSSLEAFLWSGERGLLNQHIFKVITRTLAEKHFIYYLLQFLRPVLVEIARNK